MLPAMHIMPTAKMKALFSSDRLFITVNNQTSCTGMCCTCFICPKNSIVCVYTHTQIHTHTRTNKTGNWKQDNQLWVLLLPYYPRPPNPLITPFVYPFLHFPQAVSKRITVVITLCIRETRLGSFSAVDSEVHKESLSEHKHTETFVILLKHFEYNNHN